MAGRIDHSARALRMIPASILGPRGPVTVDDDLQYRATMASDLSMCVVDAQLPDQPLVWVNPAFERVTGYRSVDILGINCRFLQGSEPDRTTTRRISAALADGRTASEVILNYRADGSPFWNHLVISPMLDRIGRLTHFVGVQYDVTDRVDAEAGRAIAQRETARANTRLQVLAAVHRGLDDRLRIGADVLSALPSIVTREFGGWVVAAGVDAEHRVHPVFADHADPARAGVGAELARSIHATALDPGDGPLNRALRQLLRLEPVVATVSAADLARSAAIPADLFRPGGGATVVGVPLLARGDLIGLLLLARDGEGSFDDGDIAAVQDLGARASMALDIGRLYSAEHDAALTLQRSLLPTLPEPADFDVAATYQPAGAQAEVGGDWYDVLDFSRPGIGVAIGDVMGHDLGAAAAMGQLRSVLRSYAWSGDGPGAVIRRLDELVRGLGMAALATCFYATITPWNGTSHELTYSSAGHPPPLLRRADGRVERLDQALISPVGVDASVAEKAEAHLMISSGDVLVLYTDGLVESRTRDVDTGISMLADALAALPADAGAQDVCDRIVAGLRGNVAGEDDLCVLVLRVRPAAIG